jgi:DNA-damage-inducible protein D
VRKILTDRNIRPEALPAAEDVKKVERRMKSEEKKLPKQAPRLGSNKKGG